MFISIAAASDNEKAPITGIGAGYEVGCSGAGQSDGGEVPAAAT
jgi:hypothetical protein